jgi:transglutaminase-like putative cysteine protease
VEDAKTTFANDDRQAVRSLGDDQLEITVRGLLRPSAKGMDNDPPSEFLRNNHFIRSDDDKVKDLSRRAVGDEKDAWAKAVKIERWVFQNISKKTFTEVFATADQAARSLEGDCTEHAMLAAAMCRAVGVPSRIAVGLVHVPNQRAMGFHMWMEVWVGGKWYALDPTLGHGHVGAAHLKISDSHWNDVQSVTPLLSVVRVLGKMKIDITSVQYE